MVSNEETLRTKKQEAGSSLETHGKCSRSHVDAGKKMTWVRDHASAIISAPPPPKHDPSRSLPPSHSLSLSPSLSPRVTDALMFTVCVLADASSRSLGVHFLPKLFGKWTSAFLFS